MAGGLGRPWRTRSIRVSQAGAWFYVKFPTGAYHSRRSYREGCDCVMGHTVHQSAPTMRYGIKQGDYYWWRAKPPNTSSTTTHLDLCIVSHWTACRYVSAFWLQSILMSHISEMLFVPYPCAQCWHMHLWMLAFEKCCMFLYLVQYNTKYYYTIGEVTVDEFWFVPPHQELDQTGCLHFWSHW
jgi:hypothetical protein